MPFFRSYAAAAIPAGLIGLILLAGTSTAQTPAWTAPVSGYVYDPVTSSIRAVAGYVGSATLGPSLIDGIDWASVAPNQKSAIVRRNSTMFWIPDLGTPGQSRSLDGIPSAQQVFWASDSSRAVILAAGGHLIWLTNLGSSPNAETDWSLEPGSARTRIPVRPSEWSLLAADSTADKVLLASQSGGHWQLWMASQATPPASIFFPGQPAAAVFGPGNATALVADVLSHQIIQVGNLGDSPTWTPLLTSAVYVNNPAGLALSTDHSRLFIADRTTNLIRVFDSGSGALITELPSDAVPQSLSTFASGLYLLNSGSLPAGPFLFLDTSPSARVTFVPRGE